ncbi:MAG: amidohydrolase family protein [Planctomycetes bacterium]|nr:amidohydrolase family protein [Planctomycetota bacterium]
MRARNDFDIIDSHTHWGPSMAMGVTVSSEELLRQADECGVDRIVVFPFPSTAIADEGIHDRLLAECRRETRFVPYYTIPADLRPVPSDTCFKGGKWHWVRGVPDAASNYQVLEDPRLDRFIERSESVGLPVVFEEELRFTESFVARTSSLQLIIPHLGLLGGTPEDFLKAFRRRENVHFDTALASQDTIFHFIQEIGAARVVFGSDVPFGTMKRELDKILALDIGDEKKRLVLSGNLKRLTGIGHEESSGPRA